MKIKLMMMLKDEDALTWPWIAYHGALVGYDNLILIDNGSTSPRTLASLDRGKALGASVDATHAAASDYINRGEMYAQFIRRMDTTACADFWLPMDCDEFLAVNQAGSIACDTASLHAELADRTYSPQPLLITAALNNHPLRHGHFAWAEQRKTFFAAHACEYLDLGFHHGRARSGLPALVTNIVYIHFHYRQFDDLVRHAKAKLAPFIDDFSAENLLRYSAAQQPNYHCVNHLLIGREAYHASFAGAPYREYPEIKAAFTRLGQRLPLS